MTALVNAEMSRWVAENVGNCWTEDRFAAHEGLYPVVLISLVILVC